jgi:general stress protein CsbA
MIWAQIINAFLGVWLMASPTVFGYAGAARINDVVVGPLAATFAIIALWEVTRTVGKANVVLGVWLVLASWVLGYENVFATVNQFVVGLIMAALAMTRANAHGKFGGGWRSLVRSRTPT